MITSINTIGDQIILEKSMKAERVVVDLCLGGTVREQRGKIIPKWVKNPTTYPTTPRFIQQHFEKSNNKIQQSSRTN